MRRAAVFLAVALVTPLLPASVSRAGIATTDVYRSHFLAHDRAGRAYTVDVVVEDRPAGTQLVIEVRRRCASCRADVYARVLGPGDLIVRQPSVANPECQCLSASVTTKFGGKELRIEWAWDLEQHSGPAGDGYEWATVTANTLMNVSCFGSGTYTTTPDPFSSEGPRPPKGARPFPKEMPRAFEPMRFAAPGCYSDTP
jgi:hypothetical protein